MSCAACQATGQWNTAPLCPACHAITGTALPAHPTRSGSPLWLWTSQHAAAALASGNLAVILKVYRTATRMTQGQLAEALGYDTTYISMIETGRRTPTDVSTLRRIAAHIGIAPHVLGVTDTDAEDFASMIQFGESTIRLATLARQAGHSAAAINELWPLILRLENRIAAGRVDRAAMRLLALGRAALGVALGDVLPEERLASAARWTGRAVRIAERLEDAALMAIALRAHGNELRKVGHLAASATRLRHAAKLAPPGERAAVLVKLARTVGALADQRAFDTTIIELHRLIDTDVATPLVNDFVLREVQLRGLLDTGRVDQAAAIGDRAAPDSAGVAPQWRVIERVSIASVYQAQGDLTATEIALRQAVQVAEVMQLPHQIQRVVRLVHGTNPELALEGAAALTRLQRTLAP
jgi:transcriptional regulator with XRE-family HTH domain